MIFDRSHHPVQPTEIGKEIIEKARQIVGEIEQLKQVVGSHKEMLSGEFRIGIIPTLAPYLLPLFLKNFTEAYPGLVLSIRENTTEQLMAHLRTGQIDAALLATPLKDPLLQEEVIFYEEFAVYAPNEPQILHKHYLLAEDINPDRLILLEEGHCLRTQVAILCELQKAQSHLSNITYEAGSLETLKRIVESHSGITILPQLALLDLTEDQMQHVRFFHPPAPVREISLVSRKQYANRRVTDALKSVILDVLPEYIKKETQRRVLEVFKIDADIRSAGLGAHPGH